MEKNNTAFEQIIEKGCGIDVRKQNTVVAVMGKRIKKTNKNSKFLPKTLFCAGNACKKKQ
jgi:hypothetical protein